MVRMINGVKHYPVSERIRFGLESMYDKAMYMITCEFHEGKISNEDLDRWMDIADECERLMHRSWLSGKDYGIAKKLTTEREWMRYNRCIASGMSDRDAGMALG